MRGKPRAKSRTARSRPNPDHNSTAANTEREDQQPNLSGFGKESQSLAFYLSLFITLAVFLTFWPAVGNGFVNWDDDALLLKNQSYRGFSTSHLWWMLTSFYAGHYHPLTWLSFAFDHSIWGMNPTGYHLTNLVLHTLNALVFFFLLLALLNRERKVFPGANLRITQICCAAGALFFALHPLRVESVAWATERRDVLSGFFLLLALFAYVKMQSLPQDGAGAARIKWYIFSLGAFVLSLFSKAWGITLPVVLLVIDVYPLRRISLRDGFSLFRHRAIVEKAPYFLLAILFGYLGFLAQYRSAMHMVADHGPLDRLMQAAYGICFYPLKTLLPVNLSPLYLLEHSFNPAEPKYILCAAIAVGVTVFLLLQWRRLPWALSAWMCYGIIVSPVLGLTQSGEQIAADRYTYLACLPFSVLASAGLIKLWRFDAAKGLFLAKGRWITGGMVLILAALSFLTIRQIDIWSDTLSLWNRAIAVQPTNYVAYNNRGNARFETGDVEGALSDFDTAIGFDPTYAKSYYNRSNVKKSRGDMPGAFADATLAINHYPAYYQAFNNRGTLRQSVGDTKGAIMDFEKALHLNPNYALAYSNRGALRGSEGDLAEALADLNRAIQLDPDYAQAFFNRGILYREKGETGKSFSDFDEAIRLNPQMAAAYLNRGILRQEEGLANLALEDFNIAIQLNPQEADAYFSRGLLLRDKGDVEGALADYNRALELDPFHLDAYVKRGGLRGNLGDLNGVIADYSKALEIAPADWPPREQLQNYIAQARKLIESQK